MVLAGTGQERDKAEGAAGKGEGREGKTISNGQVCVGVQGFLQGEEAVHPIRFGMYNIVNGRNGGIESILQGILQANMDIGVFQETKVTKGI